AIPPDEGNLPQGRVGPCGARRQTARLAVGGRVQGEWPNRKESEQKTLTFYGTSVRVPQCAVKQAPVVVDILDVNTVVEGQHDHLRDLVNVQTSGNIGPNAPTVRQFAPFSAAF
ncbi:hypothetical protein EGW08_004817, partial [Elysia chlorotica]